MFSGIGVADIAFQKYGWEVVGACEIDEYARQIYSRHFPGIHIFEDATKLEASEVPECDIICAGIPCQAFSNAGRRLGFEESRGTLFFEVARIAKQRRPRYLLIENVTGLLTHDRGKTFANILATLDELGYDAEWQVLNSKYWVPQNRPRIFIIGHLREKPFKQIFPLEENGSIYARTSEKAQVKGKRLRSEISGTIDANYSKGGGSRTMVIMTAHHSQNGRKVNDYAFALTTRQEQVVLHDEVVRMFTPLECERLQGLPDNWTEGISDRQRWKCIGNAITLPVIEEIVKRLSVDVMEKQ